MSDTQVSPEGAVDSSALPAGEGPKIPVKQGHKRLGTLAGAFLGLIAIVGYFYWSMVHDQAVSAQIQKELSENGVQLLYSKSVPRDASFSPFSSLSPTVRVVASAHNVNDDLMLRIRQINQDLSLMLNDCPITDTGLAALERKHNVRWLELRKTLITDEGLKHLRGTDLELLDISTNKIDDAGLAALGELDLPHLRVLSIENLHVSDEGLLHLARFKSLEFLSVAGTKVTPNGKRHLKGKLPQISILGGS
jgi:hypothetical protein